MYTLGFGPCGFSRSKVRLEGVPGTRFADKIASTNRACFVVIIYVFGFFDKLIFVCKVSFISG